MSLLPQINNEINTSIKTEVTLPSKTYRLKTDATALQLKKGNKTTLRGTEININDAKFTEENMTSIKLKGSTTQSTRSGKNIFNKKAEYSYTNISNTLTITTLDTGIRIKSSYTGGSPYIIYKLLDLTNYVGKTIRMKSKMTASSSNKGQYSIGLGKSDMSSRLQKARADISNEEISYIVPSAEEMGDTHFLIIYLYINGNGTMTANDYVDYTDLIVTIDNDDMTYEDYGVSPSPDYPSEIKNVEGKNILDISKYADTSLWEKTTNYFMFTPVLKEDMPKFKKILSGSMKLKGTAQNLVFGLTTEKTTSTTALRILNNGTLQNANYDLKNAENIYLTIGNSNMLSADKSEIGLIFNNYDIQLEEGTQATSYVPYNSLEIKDVGKNLFNIFDENWKIYYGTKQSDGSIKANIQNNYFVSLQNTSDYWKNYIMQNKGKTLTFSQKEEPTNFSMEIVIYGNRTSTTTGYQVVGGIKRSVSITIADDFTSVSRIELRTIRKNSVFADTTTVVTELQLEEGSTVTPYIPYQEQVVTFPLSEGQKLMEGSYLAEDGVHNKRKQVVFDGTENWVFYLDKAHTFRKSLPSMSKTGICTHYKTVKLPSVFDIDTGIYLNTSNSAIIISDPRFSTIDELKAYLAEQYSNGTPVIIEYELAKEEIIPYTEEQQEAWDKLQNFCLFDGVNNIYSIGSKIKPELELSYYDGNNIGLIKTEEDRIVGFVDNLEAIKQSIYHILSIERYAYLIYDDNYGVEFEQYIGKDFDYINATIENTLQEALLYDLRILNVSVDSIEKIDINIVAIKFTVDTIYGDLIMEVSIDV